MLKQRDLHRQSWVRGLLQFGAPSRCGHWLAMASAGFGDPGRSNGRCRKMCITHGRAMTCTGLGLSWLGLGTSLESRQLKANSSRESALLTIRLLPASEDCVAETRRIGGGQRQVLAAGPANAAITRYASNSNPSQGCLRVCHSSACKNTPPVLLHLAGVLPLLKACLKEGAGTGLTSSNRKVMLSLMFAHYPGTRTATQ